MSYPTLIIQWMVSGKESSALSSLLFAWAAEQCAFAGCRKVADDMPEIQLVKRRQTCDRWSIVDASIAVPTKFVSGNLVALRCTKIAHSTNSAVGLQKRLPVWHLKQNVLKYKVVQSFHSTYREWIWRFSFLSSYVGDFYTDNEGTWGFPSFRSCNESSFKSIQLAQYDGYSYERWP